MDGVITGSGKRGHESDWAGRDAAQGVTGKTTALRKKEGRPKKAAEFERKRAKRKWWSETIAEKK